MRALGRAGRALRSVAASMPRAGWLATGAIAAAALLAPHGGAGLLVASLAGLALAIGLVRRGRPAGALLVLGLATISIRIATGALVAGPPPEGDAVTPGRGTWMARVVDANAPSGSEQRGFLHLEKDMTREARRVTALAYARMPRHPAVVPGDVVLVEGELEPRPDDGSGFAGYLERRGAVGSLRARSMRLVGRGDGATAVIGSLRWSIDGAMARVLPEPEAGLASGILIGLRERVGREVADDFMVTGLTHVVAISGWNIALVAGIVTSLLRATGLARRSRSAIVLVAIVAYTVVAGAEASVIRAATMGGVVILARESGRPSGAAAALGVACWGLLLAEPAMIEDIGLQLSLAATAGLLALGGPATRAVTVVTRGRTPRWFEETLGISLAAQLSTLPLILIHFGRLSVISPLANVVVAPVVPFAMLGSVIGLALAPLLTSLPGLGLPLAPLLLGAWAPLAFMTRGADLLATVPFANVELGAPFDAAAALAAAVALAAALRTARSSTRDRADGDTVRRDGHAGGRDGHAHGAGGDARRSGPATRARRPLAVGLSVVIGLAAGASLLAPGSGILRVSVLDVGQGDAILLEGRHGTRLLVDGGPDPDRLVRRLDERIPLWDRHIDLAVITHPHEDHAGGIAGLAPRYRLDAVAETGLPSTSAGITELRARAARSGLRRIRLLEGDAMRLDGASIDVVWPPRHAITDGAPPSSGRVINDTSIVLVVRYGHQRILLTGDLEEDKDDDLLERLPRDGRRWDLLKVAHHGSATASSRELLDVLRPRIAAVSAGVGNTYGHPARATLERLRAVGAAIRRTDVHGTISLGLDGRARSVAQHLRTGRSATRRCPPLRLARAASAAPTIPSASAAVARPVAAPAPSAPAGGACYAREDGRPDPYRGALPAPLHVALAAARPARHRRRRGRLLPRAPGGPARRPARPPARRDCRAPP